jgi:peptide chain release factor
MMDLAEDLNISASVLETVPGDRKGTLKSALIALEGEGVKGFACDWEGPVLWTGQSMFRPGHKRKNWFVGVRFLESPETIDHNDRQYKIETMRSSGPGGSM